jgi:hypothetical protein
MPWVRFLADFDWKPMPAVTVAYKANMVRLVTRDCAAVAVAAAKAINTERPANVSGKNAREAALPAARPK